MSKYRQITYRLVDQTQILEKSKTLNFKDRKRGKYCEYINQYLQRESDVKLFNYSNS